IFTHDASKGCIQPSGVTPLRVGMPFRTLCVLPIIKAKRASHHFDAKLAPRVLAGCKQLLYSPYNARLSALAPLQ
ncbi:hypothetical protein, partial [Pseudomonas syringae]|uniref:hypothetical protein n=1 Tax=Pseudomonas syringae TaxID=317 RepID=UPI00195BD770